MRKKTMSWRNEAEIQLRRLNGAKNQTNEEIPLSSHLPTNSRDGNIIETGITFTQKELRLWLAISIYLWFIDLKSIQKTNIQTTSAKLLVFVCIIRSFPFDAVKRPSLGRFLDVALWFCFAFNAAVTLFF